MQVFRYEFGVTPANPTFVQPDPALPPLPGMSSTNGAQQLQPCDEERNKQSNMSRYIIKDNANCLNTTNSYITNVLNYSVADDRSQLLTWLSPLDPGLRHWDIQERRVKNVGEWLIQTKEFRRWCGLSGEGCPDKAVLFCYGDPGVGKTFIR